MMIDPNRIPWGSEELAEFEARRELLNLRCDNAYRQAETKRILDAFKVHGRARG